VREIPEKLWTTSDCLTCRHIGRWPDGNVEVPRIYVYAGWIRCGRWRSPGRWAYPNSHDVKWNSGPCGDYERSRWAAFRKWLKTILK